jgi:shikimate kinase
MDLIQERYTIYEQADIIVQSDDESHEVTMNRVLTALEEYWGHKL